MDSLTTAAIVGLVVALLFLIARNATKRSAYPLPPGPKPLPIIGNALDMMGGEPSEIFVNLTKQYGDLVHVKIFGQSIILVGSPSIAYDLFEKRSGVYSGRAHSNMIIDLMGWGWSFGMMSYGEEWKKHRKVFHQYFNQNVVDKYRPFQTQETRALLRRLLDTPEDLLIHVRITFAATIMNIAYGINVKDKNDRYVQIAEQALGGLSAAAVPGAYMVDQIPLLKYLPSWFPGGKFQLDAQEWRRLAIEMSESPFAAAKKAWKEGTFKPSMVASILDNIQHSPNFEEDERVGKNCAGVAYSGGADTTVAGVQTFFLAMLCHQDIQAKAHAELDAVVGRDKLPDFGDKDRLPFINAIIKETMRWQPVAPLAVPHYTTENDIYNDMFIPAGAIVMGNATVMLHDPVLYPDPWKFNPDRFIGTDGKLDPKVRDPNNYAFGFGRRICPGRFLSENSLFSVISSVLSVYSILPPLDEQGKEIHIEPKWTTGLVQYPVPFKCRIVPRFDGAVDLIRHSETEEVL